MADETPPGFFRITATDSGVATAGRLGSSPPTLSGGVGGWAVIPRPKRSPITEWDAAPERRLALDVMFDGWRAGESVETAIANLERLSATPGSGKAPPVVKVSGNIPRSDLEWVIDDVQFGEAIWQGGVRVRQAASITLIEYVVGKLLIVAAKPTGKTRLVKVRKGDNLKKIAARVLGNANRWREIAALNGRETYTLVGAMVGKYVKVPPR